MPLVAVSTGLLNNMSQDEAEAVLGHEVVGFFPAFLDATA